MKSVIQTALVVDDLPATCRWLASALELAYPGIAIAVAGSLDEAQQYLDPVPQLALIDLDLPDGPGTRLIERLAANGCCCIVASVFDDDAHLFPALNAGAQGYILKDQSQVQLAAMLQGIGAGTPALSASIARRLLRHFQPALPTAPPSGLTARETEVLCMIAKGHKVADVARLLALSPHTVSDYLKDIYRKLSVHNRAEATLEAVRLGLIREG